MVCVNMECREYNNIRQDNPRQQKEDLEGRELKTMVIEKKSQGIQVKMDITLILICKLMTFYRKLKLIFLSVNLLAFIFQFLFLNLFRLFYLCVLEETLSR